MRTTSRWDAHLISDRACLAGSDVKDRFPALGGFAHEAHHRGLPHDRIGSTARADCPPAVRTVGVVGQIRRLEASLNPNRVVGWTPHIASWTPHAGPAPLTRSLRRGNEPQRGSRVAIPQQPRAEPPTAAASVDMDRPAPSLDLDRAVSFHAGRLWTHRRRTLPRPADVDGAPASEMKLRLSS
jgi:hypothetical protein